MWVRCCFFDDRWMCECCCALEFDGLSRAAQVLSLCLCLRAEVSELRFCAVALLLHPPSISASVGVITLSAFPLFFGSFWSKSERAQIIVCLPGRAAGGAAGGPCTAVRNGRCGPCERKFVSDCERQCRATKRRGSATSNVSVGARGFRSRQAWCGRRWTGDASQLNFDLLFPSHVHTSQHFTARPRHVPSGLHTASHAFSDMSVDPVFGCCPCFPCRGCS